MKGKRVFFVLICLFVFSSLIKAQEIGNFVGTVNDEEGNALPGATITAKNTLTGLTQSTITNAQGRYRLERLTRGLYEISASLPGFKTITKEQIELFSGGENRVDFKMEPGMIEEEVTVIGQTPMVETTRSQVSTVMTEKELLSYPQANRNFLNLIAYAPGTQPDAPTIGGSGFAVNGMRGESNNYTLDGINNNDMTDNSMTAGITSLPPEAIQEFRLVSNNFNVEYGRNTGGFLNVVMKSGTNEFHGSGWMFYRGAGKMFRTADWLTGERPDYSRNQFGATLGGPIKKDKTFFFATFEGVNQSINNIVNPYVFTPDAIASAVGPARAFFDKYGSAYPTATSNFIDANGDGVMDYGRGILDYKNSLTSYSGGIKIDHIFNEKDRVAFRWLYNYNSFKDGLPYYWVPGKQLERPQDYHTGGLSWLHLFGPTAYNEVRVGFHKEHWEEKVQDPTMAAFAWFDEPMGFGDVGYPMYQDNTTYQISDVLNFQKGNHSLKVGGELRYWRVNCMFDADVLGQYVYVSGMDFINNLSADYMILGANPPDPPADNPYVPGNPAGEWITGFDLTWRKWKGTEVGLFVQDDWRISDRLTVTLGLRWDYYSVPQEFSGVGINQPAFGTQQGFESKELIEGKYDPDNPADPANREGIQYLIFDGRQLMGKGIWNPYYGGFAPKVSLAYDLTGDGKTSLRAGYGIGYERQMNRNYENDRFNYPDFCFATFFGEPEGFAPLYATVPGSLPPVENRAGFRTSLRWMDPELKPQMAHNWLLGIQREITTNSSVEIDYAGSAGRRIGTLTAINRFTGDGVSGGYTGYNPYAGIRDVYFRENRYKSNYHSLQVVLRKRFAQGWSWYSAYTLSKAKDQVSAYQFGPLTSIEREDMDYGFADFDHAHRLVGGFVFELPFFKNASSWAMRNILGGWQLGGSFHVTSGQRFSVYAASSRTDYNRDGVRWDWPLWLGGSNDEFIQKGSDGTPSLDPGQVGVPTPPAAEHDLGYYNQKFVKRNQFTWYPTHNVDLSLQKYFKVTMGGREVTLQLIGEVFNVIKFQNWEMPVLDYSLGSFGEVTRRIGERTGQVSFRVLF